jgi:hypothetical protein
MEIIDRYLQAVRLWLPKSQKQDIIAELSEDIRSQIEEKEADLGRNLNDTEVEAILIERGSPILVASRYLPQQHLIGPLLFPIYSLILKMAWLFCFVPWLFVWICIVSFVPSYRTENPGTLIVGALHTVWLMVVYTFASVTVSFALIEKYHLKSGFLEKWDPRKLPPIYDFHRIKRSSSIAEIVALVVVCTWWIGVMSSPAIVNNAELHITLAPAWQYFFWGFLLLAAANLVLSGVNLFRPHWTRLRASMRLLSDCIGCALFAWLCNANILKEISMRDVSYEKTMQIATAINLWASRSLPVVIAVGVVIAAIRVKRTTHLCFGGLTTTWSPDFERKSKSGEAPQR